MPFFLLHESRSFRTPNTHLKNPSSSDDLLREQKKKAILLDKQP